MRYPRVDCDGDCFHCPLPDCQSGNYPPHRLTPFEREQSAIRREKAKCARARKAHIKAVEAAFTAWKKRNGINGYKTGGKKRKP